MMETDTVFPEMLADVVRNQAKQRPTKIAFKFEGSAVSFSQLDELSNQTANGLLALGLEPNERVGYIGKNSDCLLYTSPSPRDATLSRMPSSA